MANHATNKSMGVILPKGHKHRCFIMSTVKHLNKRDLDVRLVSLIELVKPFSIWVSRTEEEAVYEVSS